MNSSGDNRSTALLTDQYELTMLQAALSDGTAERRCTFELFGRRLPDGRRYGVVAGIQRVLDAIERFHFDADDIAFLRHNRVVDERTCQWLSEWQFNGDIWGYAEGEVYFPGSPILIVQGTFADCVVLETLALSILNHDSAIASAASRMVTAAGERPCLEMGTRRTHEEAGVAAARAAYIGGFSSTSNLMAGARYQIPTTGTSAHAFTLLHDTERDAFRAQVDSLGHSTTLLIDTYDVREAVRTAVDAGGPQLGAVRIDSGDLPSSARSVRAQLDSLGNTDTRIVVTSDLDEFAIAALAAAPVDGYGVGTALVTGSGAPTCGLVYKLVAREGAGGEMEPVAKTSTEKSSVGGRKWAARAVSPSHGAHEELIGIGGATPDDDHHRNLLCPLMERGHRVHDEGLDQARQRLQEALSELPADATKLSRGEPAIPTRFVEQS